MLNVCRFHEHPLPFWRCHSYPHTTDSPNARRLSFSPAHLLSHPAPQAPGVGRCLPSGKTSGNCLMVLPLAGGRAMSGGRTGKVTGKGEPGPLWRQCCSPRSPAPHASSLQHLQGHRPSPPTDPKGPQGAGGAAYPVSLPCEVSLQEPC